MAINLQVLLSLPAHNSDFYVSFPFCLYLFFFPHTCRFYFNKQAALVLSLLPTFSLSPITHTGSNYSSCLLSSQSFDTFARSIEIIPDGTVKILSLLSPYFLSLCLSCSFSHQFFFIFLFSTSPSEKMVFLKNCNPFFLISHFSKSSQADFSLPGGDISHIANYTCA